jgi:putative glutamine amidotransferase
MSAKPVIGIPVDALDLNGKPFHGVGEKYVNAVAHGSHAIPFFIPVFGSGRSSTASTACS